MSKFLTLNTRWCHQIKWTDQRPNPWKWLQFLFIWRQTTPCKYALRMTLRVTSTKSYKFIRIFSCWRGQRFKFWQATVSCSQNRVGERWSIPRRSITLINNTDKWKPPFVFRSNLQSGNKLCSISRQRHVAISWNFNVWKRFSKFKCPLLVGEIYRYYIYPLINMTFRMTRYRPTFITEKSVFKRVIKKVL